MAQELIKTDGEFGVPYGRPFAGSERLKHFPIPWEGVSPPVIPYFAGARASLANDYLRYFDNRRRRRLTQLTSESLSAIKEEYIRKLVELESHFGHLFTRYDDEIVLQSTCALGMLRPAHFDMDEKGIFGTGRRTRYPKEALSFIERDMLKLCRLAEGTISMKRGTNLGWPTPKGGRSRDEGDALLALHVAAVLGARNRSMRLGDLQKVLESWYGPCFAIAGERYQTTERVIPVFYLGGRVVTHNFAQRVRGIYFSPKFMVAWNRRAVKTLLSGIMNHPMHEQRRPELKKKIARMTNPDHICFSLDVSRFDQSHGIEVVEDILRLMSHVCAAKGLGAAEDVFSDLLTEFVVPDVVPTSRDLFWEKGGQILSSGLSMTSIVGCLSSHAIAYTLAKYLSESDWSNVDTQFGHEWDALTWGDDVVFSISKSYLGPHHRCSSMEELLPHVEEAGKAMELKFSFEPTIKFLGQNYDMLAYSGIPTGYPIGRFIQQQFFPERSKDFPFAEIGYIARLQLMDESLRAPVHQAMKSCWPFTLQWWPLSECNSVLLKLLPEVEKVANKISQLDDIFGVFTHGLDPADADLSDFEEFSDLLGLGSVDVTDPSGFLTSQGRVISNHFLRCVRDVQQGDLSKFHEAVDELARLYGSKAPIVGQIYY